MQLNKNQLQFLHISFFFFFDVSSVLLLGLLSSADAALPFKKVSIAKTPASTTSTSTTTTEAPEPATEKEELPTAEGDESKVSILEHTSSSD